jgi:hypothetical protein
MSCYACVLGNLDEARTRLAKAFELVEKAQAKNVKLLALDDPDLERLWVELK